MLRPGCEDKGVKESMTKLEQETYRLNQIRQVRPNPKPVLVFRLNGGDLEKIWGESRVNPEKIWGSRVNLEKVLRSIVNLEIVWVVESKT